MYLIIFLIACACLPSTTLEMRASHGANVDIKGFSEEVLDRLMLVQVTPAVAKDGVARARSYDVHGQATADYRPVQYFALNTIVPDFGLVSLEDLSRGRNGSVVDSRDFVILIPYRNIEHQILNLWPIDTIVKGDIYLSYVNAIILHPEGQAPEFDDGVCVRIVAYTDDKRDKVQSLLGEMGYAVLHAMDRVTLASLSAIYHHSSAGVFQLGAGPGFGDSNIDFIRTKYGGHVSYGAEAYLFLRNGATEFLLGLMMFSSVCDVYSFKWQGYQALVQHALSRSDDNPRFRFASAAFQEQDSSLRMCVYGYLDSLPVGSAVRPDSFEDVFEDLEAFLQVFLEPDLLQSFFALFSTCRKHVEHAFIRWAADAVGYAIGRTIDAAAPDAQDEPFCKPNSENEVANAEYKFYTELEGARDTSLRLMKKQGAEVMKVARKTKSALQVQLNSSSARAQLETLETSIAAVADVSEVANSID
eukprot:TRINITY_DN71710_c0_g1_i1.p1 TRINITY_DN71710_c0_g1~~TRINITY_DN71710_c0_g1_i1.p1  ORF type:complete len:473 (+),score=28.28 TRINITY_DN71710_c0_g1_i1:242-1660(+)